MKKVHQTIFRIKETSDWKSRWFSKRDFDKILEEDFRIREFLTKKIGRLGVEKIEIERFPGKINIIISSARPGLIIGRRGEGVELLKQELENKVLKKKKPSSSKDAPITQQLKLEIKEVKDVWSSAPLVCQWICQQIEKRVPYRRVLKQALDKIMFQKGVEGARVEVAGRLNGVEIARTEWLQKGKLPRQTLRADIDYAYDSAYCTYGVIGVKVWIYKGEKF